MASKIEDLYFRFVNEFIADLKTDDFYAYFSNMIRSGQSNVSLNEKFVERNIDLRWVEAIEDTIIPLDNIIRTPNRYIKNIEEIVPIEMARTISTESVRHLATHTNFIAQVKGDEVTPSRILNVIKEESFDTYENRFIFTLLFKLEYFLDKRMQILMTNNKVADRYEMKFDGNCKAGHDEISYDFTMNYVTPHVELTSEELQVGADISHLTSMQRIERLRKILYSFKNSALIKALAGCAMVRPPLTMTNVLTKNPNFRKCVDLWGFIERYEDVGFSVNVVERASTPSDQYISDMFSLITLQYVVMKKNTVRTGELGDYFERRKVIEPNVVKKNITDIIETYDLDIDEIKRVFIDQIEKKRKKIKAEFAKIKDVIKRAIATDKEYLAGVNERRKVREAKEAERLLKEQKEREEQERLARLEQERLEREAREEEERLARLEQERLEREARERQERLERELLISQERLEREKEANRAKLESELEQFTAEELTPEVTELEVTEPEVSETEATEPEATETEVTEPEVTEPEEPTLETTELETTEPETTEPEVTEPEVTETEVTEPEVTAPEVTEPEATEPEITEPEITEPEITEPEATEPEATEPEITEPEATEPEATEPEITEPEVTEPEATEPEVTEPEATEPEVTEPEATEPEVTEPEVTEPEATEPEATEPEITEAEVAKSVAVENKSPGLFKKLFSSATSAVKGFFNKIRPGKKKDQSAEAAAPVTEVTDKVKATEVSPVEEKATPTEEVTLTEANIEETKSMKDELVHEASKDEKPTVINKPKPKKVTLKPKTTANTNGKKKKKNKGFVAKTKKNRNSK